METLSGDSSLNLPPPPLSSSSSSSSFFKTLLATPGPPPGPPPPTTTPISPMDMLQFSKPPPLSFLFSGPPPEIFSDQCSEGPSDPTRNPRYKTEICRNFKERARCIYGDQCQFAHGRRELRDVVRNNKYKTKMCQKYWVAGYCAYGPRCNFLHDEDKAMSEVALKEYGLTKMPEEKRSSFGEECNYKTDHYDHQLDFNRLNCLSPFSGNPSPVNLLEVENLGCLDYLMSTSSHDYCFGPFLTTMPSSFPDSTETTEKQNFEAKKLEDETSSECSL